MSDLLFRILEQDWFTFSVECVGMAAAYAACLAAVVLVVCLAVGRRLAPRYRHALWLLVALRLFLPIAPESRFSLHRLWLDQFANDADATPAGVGGTYQDLWVMPSALPSADPAMSWTMQSWTEPSPSTALVAANQALALLVLAWPAGMLCTGGWIALATWRCRGRMRRLAAIGDPRLLAVLESCRLELAVRRRVELMLVPGLLSPAQMGLFRPKILLPSDVARDFSDDELRHILLHELAHVKRRDVAVNMALSLLQVIYWWNPVFWFVRGRLIAERELACDALVVGAIGAARSTSYGRTLIRIVERLTETATAPWRPPASAPGLIAFLGRAAALRSRLRHLPRSTTGNSRTAQVAAWLLIAVLALTGLTDARSDTDDAPSAESTFNLPQSMTWSVAPEVAPDEQPPQTAVYDCGPVLDRFVREEHFSRDVARKVIADTLQPSNARALKEQDGETTDRTCRVSFEWQENRLLCLGPPPVVASMANVLNAWREHGLQQICCSVQWIDSPIDVVNKLGLTGGEIISSTGREEFESSVLASDAIFRQPQTDAPIQVRSSSVTERRFPIYVKVLDPVSAQRLTRSALGEARANLRRSPKVAIFQGQEARIQDTVLRPFVVGMRSAGDERTATQIRVVSEGSQLRLGGCCRCPNGSRTTASRHRRQPRH